MPAAPRVVPRVVASLALLTSVVTLCGCVGEKPDVQPSASASASVSAAPVFASEEDALAAADSTYASYLATSDAVTSAAGSDPERIAPLVTPAYLPTELAGFAEYAADGSSTSGVTRFDSVDLQQIPADLTEGGVFTVYLCADFSEIRILDASGADVTPADRPLRVPLEVDFLVAGLDPVTLQIDRNEVWTGKDFC